MKLRRLFLVFLAFISWPLFVSAGDGLKPSEDKTKEAMQKVISSQLEAFRADNYDAAYVFADLAIRRLYPVQMFERMVKRGYPMIAHSVSASFGLSLDNGDEATINVRITGPDHQAETYQYQLRLEGVNWKIMGVVPLKDHTTEV